MCSNTFQRGGVGLKKPSMREVWIICGTTHLIARILWFSKFFSKLIDTYCNKTDLQTKVHFTAGYMYADFVVVLNENCEKPYVRVQRCKDNFKIWGY